MPKIKNYSKFGFNTPKTHVWHHDDLNLSVRVTERNTRSPENWKTVVKASSGKILHRDYHRTKSTAMDDARDWMRKHPDKESISYYGSSQDSVPKIY